MGGKESAKLVVSEVLIVDFCGNVGVWTVCVVRKYAESVAFRQITQSGTRVTASERPSQGIYMTRQR